MIKAKIGYIPPEIPVLNRIWAHFAHIYKVKKHILRHFLKIMTNYV